MGSITQILLSALMCRSYGDEQHLEEALERVFMIGRPTGIPRRQCPRLEGLREEVSDGKYTLVMEFVNRNNLSEEQWQERETKFATFFGPGISAKVCARHRHNLSVIRFATVHNKVLCRSMCLVRKWSRWH